jgi:hypothetical protein
MVCDRKGVDKMLDGPEGECLTLGPLLPSNTFLTSLHSRAGKQHCCQCVETDSGGRDPRV